MDFVCSKCNDLCDADFKGTQPGLCDRCSPPVAVVKQQHDELLAALRRIADYAEACDPFSNSDCLDPVREIARAAIANAEGEHRE